MKKIMVACKLWLLLLFMVNPNIVFARSKTSCDYTLLSNLKSITSNVNISYTYHIDNDDAYFDITLTNIRDNIYFIDNTNNKIYYYTDTSNGIITIPNYHSGKVSFSFYSYHNECMNEKLAVKNVILPLYNKYYNYPECEGVTNLKACEKWSGYSATLEDFKSEVTKYKEKKDNNDTVNDNQNLTWFNKLVNIYTNYFYIITPLFVGTIVGIVYLVKYIEHRRNRFKI